MFHELKQIIPEMFHTHKSYISNFVHKFIYVPVSEHFSFAKIIHPPDRCGMSRSGLNGMIITQVHLVLGKIKGHSKMCIFVTHHNAKYVSSFEGVCNWHADCRKVRTSLVKRDWVKCGRLLNAFSCTTG